MLKNKKKNNEFETIIEQQKITEKKLLNDLKQCKKENDKLSKKYNELIEVNTDMEKLVKEMDQKLIKKKKLKKN